MVTLPDAGDRRVAAVHLAQIAVGLGYQITICDPHRGNVDIPDVALVRTCPATW
jgi:hypothetical protein